MLVDQSPDGLEVLRGSSTYTYDGNWKVQAENGADGYHVTATHWNYAATTSRRSTGESKNDTKALDAGSWGKSGGGYWSFPHGHLCLWTWAGNPQDRPLWDKLDELKAELRRRQGRVHGQGLPQSVPLPECLCDGPVLDADPPLPSRSRRTRPRSPSTASHPRGRATRPARTGSASTRTSSTPPAWPPPTTWRSSGPASSPSGPQAAPWNDMSRGAEHWLTGPDDGRRIAGHARRHLGRCQERGRGALPGAARLLAGDHAGRVGPRTREGELTMSIDRNSVSTRKQHSSPRT